MSARDEHLADVLCHCDQTDGLPADGHPLGTPGCASEIKAGSYSRAKVPSYGPGYRPDDRNPWTGARGTCPDCGTAKRIKVRRVRLAGQVPGQVPRSRKDHQGVSLGYAPALEAHRTPGRGGDWCPGAGKVPTELIYTSPRAVTDWARQYGPEFVDLGGAAVDLPPKEPAQREDGAA